MRKQVIMPKVGLDMEEGAVHSWLVKVGEKVTKGSPLMEIETDKVITTIDSSETGVLVEILVEDEEMVPIGTTIAWIEV